MSGDNFDRLYDALKTDGAVNGTREDFKKYVYAPGKEGYQNRKKLYDALHADGAIQSGTYEEFARKMGLHAVAPKQKHQTTAQKAMQMNTKKATTPSRKKMIADSSEFVQGLYAADKAKENESKNTDYTTATVASVDKANRSVEKLQMNDAADNYVNKESRRRDKPIIDTGNEKANTYIVKTQGQLEDEMDEAANQLVASSGNMINGIIEKERKQATLDAEKELRSNDANGNPFMGGAARGLFDMNVANQYESPEKLMENIQKNILANVETLRPAAEKQAQSLGISSDAYLKQIVLPKVVDKAIGDFQKSELAKNMPKDGWEYFAREMASSNTLGKLWSLMFRTKGQRQMDEEAMARTNAGVNPNYKPSTATQITADIAGFATDPVFAKSAKLGTAVAGKLIGNGTKIAALMANGNLAQRMGIGFVNVITSGGATGFVFDSISSVIQNYSTGEDTSLGNTLNVAFKGGVKGAANFATMSMAGVPLSQLGRSVGLGAGGSFWGNAGRVTGKVGLEAGKTYMEGMGMYLGGYVAGKIEGATDANGKPIEFDLWGGTLESLPTAVGFRLQHALNGLRGGRKDAKGNDMGWLSSTCANMRDFLTSDKAKASTFAMTEDERSQIMDSYHEAQGSSKYSFDNVVTAARNGKKERKYDNWYESDKKYEGEPIQFGDVESDVETVRTVYDKVMADPNVSWDAKAKFSAMVTGIMPSARPVVYAVRFGSDAENKYMCEYSKNGELLSKVKYDNANQRDAMLFKVRMTRDNIRMKNAVGGLLLADKNNYDLQNAFYQAKLSEGKSQEEIIAGMQDPESEIGKEYSRYAFENGSFREVAQSAAAASGMPFEKFMSEYIKDPMKRSEEGQAACTIFRKMVEARLFPEGKVHEEQSNLDGKDVAEDNGLGTEKLNGESVRNELNNLSEAEQEMDELIKSNDVFGQNFSELQKKGLSNPQIYEWMIENGLTEEQLAPFARYINANARVQGMQDATQQKIEEKVSQYTQDWSLHGTLNGEKQNGNQAVWIKDSDGRALIVGSGEMAFDSATGRAKEGVGDMLVCFDPDKGEMVYVKTDDVTFFKTQELEDFGNEYRRKLQIINSRPYNEAAAEQAMRGNGNGQMPGPEDAGEKGGEPQEGNQTEPGKGIGANQTAEGTVEESKKKAWDAIGKLEGTVVNEGTTKSGKHWEDKVTKRESGSITVYSVERFVEGEQVGGAGKSYFPIPKGLHIAENFASIYEKDGGKVLGVHELRSDGKGYAGEVVIEFVDENGKKNNVTESVVFSYDNDNIDGYKVGDKIKLKGNGDNFSKSEVQEVTITGISAAGKVDYDYKGKDGHTRTAQMSKDVFRTYLVEGGSPIVNDGEGSIPPKQEAPALTFEDGAPVPMTKDSKGRDTADYTQMTPEHGAEWLTRTFGENADKVADGKIKKAEAALKQAQKIKVDYTADDADIIEAETAKKNAEDAAKRDIDFFTAVKNAMKKKKAFDEAGGNGVTGNRYEKWREDGYYIAPGNVRYDRQKKEDQTGVYGREVKVDFAPKVSVKGRAKVVEIDSVQASHRNGQVNPWHFGPDWQPKDRTDAASYVGQKQALDHFDPEKITGDGNAYIDSAPSINERHETIQGNNRIEILRRLYDEYPEKAAEYKQWLIDNAERFGLDAAEIAKMKRPVYVNELPVDDVKAKELGQHDVKEFESGGKATPRTSAVINLLGDKMQTVTSVLMRQGELPDDAKISDLIARNADDALYILSKEGVITATEEQTLRKDRTALRLWLTDLLKNGLFEGDTMSEAEFSRLPDNAQKAVLATYPRDAKSPEEARIKKTLLRSFEAYTRMMEDPGFANAKNLAEARAAVNMEIEKGNKSLFGEAAVREEFSTFELELAALYRGLKDQKTLTGLINKYFDAVQGDKATNRQLELGETPREPISKEEAIKEVFNAYDTKPAETQRQVDEALKTIATEITKQTGAEVVTDENTFEQVRKDNADSIKEQRGRRWAGGEVLGMDKLPENVRMNPDELWNEVSQYHGDYITKSFEGQPEDSTGVFVSCHKGIWYVYSVSKEDMSINIFDAIPAKREGFEKFKQQIEGYGFDTEAENIYSNLQTNGSTDRRDSDLLDAFLRGGLEHGNRIHLGESKGKANNAASGLAEQAGRANDESNETRTRQIKQFRGKNGEVYGFALDGKIYLDLKKMKPETPIHEYTHLWTETLKRVNPEEWENVKKLFDEVEGLKEEVQKLYPELEGDDLYEEMVTTYSGREGAKKLEAEARRLAAEEGKSVTESAKATTFIGKVKEALQKYWKGAADMLHIHFTSAEEVADKVLADWASGLDPKKVEAPEEEGNKGVGKPDFSDLPVFDGVGRWDKSFLKNEAWHAYLLSQTEANPLNTDVESKKKEAFERFVARLTESAGKVQLRNIEPHLREYFDYFERKANGLISNRPKGKTPIDEAALKYHEEKVEAARKAFEEAKASGDESEIKRTRDELKQSLDDKYKAQGMGLVQRRKEIAKEIGTTEAKKINKPWAEMDGEERIAVAEKNPLTEDEIRNNTSEENRELIEDAIDYLNGNHGFVQQLAYLKIYDDVRNRHEDAPGNSGAEDGTQLAATGNGSGEGLGLGTGREGGGSSGDLGRGTGEGTVPGGQLPGGKDSAGQPDLPAGERGNSEGEGGAPGLGGLPAGDTQRTGGGTDGGNGTTLRHVGVGNGGNGNTGTNAGGKPATKQRTTWRNRSGEEIKQEAKDAKAGLKAALAEMKKRGRGEVSISLVGLNSRQIEYVPELMKAVKRYGMSLIDQGIYKIKDWMNNIREGIYDDMKSIGFSDKDIDDFIEEMWNSKMPMDGETHTIAEWCSIYGHAQLREKLGEELGAKYQRQVDAEPVEVKIGDRKNIEETLPFLLPQQQDDVLRAETQFFGNEHADREHAYGKGYMFTNGTGTGKTYTGLGIAKRLQKQGKGRILIVTPSQKKVTDWIKDGRNLNMEIRSLDDWATDRGTTATTESGEGMVITTYANMRANKKLLETEWDAVIYDESHRIMENKKGAETAGSLQHYMMTNRNENYCFLRLQDINKDYQKMRRAGDRFDAERNKEIERIREEYKRSHPGATERDVMNATFKMLPKDISNFSLADAAAFPKIGKAFKEFTEAREHYCKNVEPKLKEQAKATWKNTKTVFLSATPFNTRENLDYAEGYIFKFPERDASGMDGRTRFYLDNFGAAYKFRYNRLESSMSNPDAVAKQEIAFSDYLQNTLGTMSGRIIDSPYDYSRDFPTVAPDRAEEFNQAVQEAVRGRHLGSAYRKTIGDYNYGSALFETMKVANIIDRIKQHLDAGRKVVIFHRRVEMKVPIQPPFSFMLEVAGKEIKDMRPGKERNEYMAEVSAFREKYADLLQWEKTLDYSMPREQIAKVFGKDKVLFFSGSESKKVKDKAVDTFNDDNSGKNIIVIQEAAGKEGISLHDTTGKHQRVCITLALPQSPITALQIEGRTYRIGNKSNAIFEYPILGLNSEMMLFGEKFNNQVSTTENLALGSQARNLRDSFANGILEHSGVVPIDQQGVGGKEFDAPKQGTSDPFEDAVLDYYSNQKLNKRNREGVDYFPTPEPLGYKMVEWARMGEGDTALEPSAGHGAIARYVPKENQMVSIEPSQSLFTKLQLKAGGLGRKFLNTTFENYDIGNKHDVVVMNPPFGTAGATAIAHLDKAFKHLDEGGRVVAIIPRGSTDKKFDKWFDGQKNAAMRAEVDLPDIVFQQAGTSVRCRVVVVDKITDAKLRSKAGYPEKIDLDGRYDKIEDFFEELRDIDMPERIIDTQAKMQKKARAAARDMKDIKDVMRVNLDKSGISVSLRGEWKDFKIDFEGSDNTRQWQERMKQTYTEFDELEKSTWNENKKAVCDEMKKLACKLAGMTEEEMRRNTAAGREGRQGGAHFRTEEDENNSVTSISKDAPVVVKHIAKVSKKVGGKVNMVQSVDEVTDPKVREAIEAGKNVTGWYDEKTGEVYLYMPNIHDRYTAEKTIWHEQVGHKGMRGLMGEHFDKFLREVWYDLDNPENAELKRLVDEERQKNPLNIYDAIEEGISRLAEDGKGEPGFWNNIKNKVADLFREIGYRFAPNTKDVKYLLWLSKNMQKHPNDPFFKMRAEAVRYRLEHEDVPDMIVGDGIFHGNTGHNHADLSEMPKAEYQEMTDGRIHFRTAPSTATAIDRYHRALNAHGYMATESFMDNMLSLQALMKAVDPSIKKIEDVKSSENPYILQNTMQGAMSNAAQMFERNVMKPLDAAMGRLLGAFEGKKDVDKIRNFNLYMITKHGLERNRVFFVRDYVKGLRADEATVQDADILQKQWDAEKKDLGDRLRNGQLTLKDYYAEMDEWIRNNVDKDFDASEHDSSGMHGLQEIDDMKAPYNDAEAIQSVMDTEAQMESLQQGSVKDFWDKVNAATSYSLYCDYANGFQSKEAYTKTSQMFDWYVPLRKFDEETAEDVYGYVTEKGDPSSYIGSIVMGAKGRKSLSEVNVLAQIGAMGNKAISNGGKNAIKQAFMRFARTHDSQGLITEGQVWLVKDGTNADGSDRWVEAYPQIPDGADPNTVSNIVSQFEVDMKAKQATGDAKVMRNAADVGYKFERAKDKSQHVVDVKVNGKTHRFYINGNPRAAQALNGMLENKGPKWLKPVSSITRTMAQLCTSWSPEFVMRNIVRDMQFALSNVTAKEGAKYGLKWGGYYAMMIPIGAGNIKMKDLSGSTGLGLYAKYRNGTLDMSNKIHKYFKEFMENGGETGWVQVLDMKKWEKKYKRDIKAERSKLNKGGKALRDFFFGNLENINTAAENMARFATYCTSRDYGRSVVRSAYDAKEVSTNFNRHGSGDAIWSFKNGETGGLKKARRDTYGFISSYLRQTSMFFNAGIQSTNLLFKNFKNAPKGTITAMMGIPFALGALVPLLNQWLISQEDEKDRDGVKDPYAEMPDYIRRNNLCIYKGNGEFITVPLAIELRAFYGLGDLTAGMSFSPNIKTTRPAWADAVGCISQLVPVMDYTNSHAVDKNPLNETIKALSPSAISPFVEWGMNSDWKGSPIRRETTSYNKYAPAWQRAYKNTPQVLMELNKKVNAWTNDIAPGNEDMLGNGFLDALTNPAGVNHFISGYGGGAATFATRIAKLIKSDDAETNDILFLRSFLYKPNEQSSMQRTKSKWYDYVDKTEKTMSNIDRLKSKNVPIDKRLENIGAYYKIKDSNDAMKARIIEQAQKQMKKLQKMRNKSSDAAAIDNANKSIDLIMQDAVERLDRMD